MSTRFVSISESLGGKPRGRRSLHDPLLRFGTGPFRRFAEWGTAGYPREEQRKLMIVNVMALMIAGFSALYAVVFLTAGFEKYWPLIIVNFVFITIGLLAPLAHKINGIAAALIICITEYFALFMFVRELGHNSGVQLNYIVAAALVFAIWGMARIRLAICVVALGLALHLLAWFFYPPGSARIDADPELLQNLYISSATSTFLIIALVAGYAFTMADRARAEADSLLASMLPEPIANRLKTRPDQRVADAVPDASVLFSDLVGFTMLAQRIGPARTIDILDRIVREFDRLAAEHGVEKIKTVGDGYMAVAGASQPLEDHVPRIARMALCLPGVVAKIADAQDIELRIRIGIASGPLMAGIIGAGRFSYDVWGETVNRASRLESHGIAGEIQVSAEVREALGDAFLLEPRGPIDVKGLGLLETWILKAEHRPKPQALT